MYIKYFFSFIFSSYETQHSQIHSQHIQSLPNFLSMPPISFAPSLLSTIRCWVFSCIPLHNELLIPPSTPVSRKHVIGFSFGCCHLPSVFFLVFFSSYFVDFLFVLFCFCFFSFPYICSLSFCFFLIVFLSCFLLLVIRLCPLSWSAQLNLDAL